jgi:hypothetical protein
MVWRITVDATNVTTAMTGEAEGIGNAIILSG